MKREKEDLSILSVATASTNKTAISGMLVMNLVLALAYAIEVVKHARGIGSYLIILALCVLPSVLAIGVFVRKKDALTVRYIFAVGFALSEPAGKLISGFRKSVGCQICTYAVSDFCSCHAAAAAIGIIFYSVSFFFCI